MKRLYFLLLLVFPFMFASCAPGDEPAKANYSITLTAGNGIVAATVNGQEVTEAAEGATVTLTVTPAPGSVFDKWISETQGVIFADAEAATTTFIMPAKDVKIIAEYRLADTYSITVTDNGNGTAKATIGGETVTEAAEGTAVTLTATPDSGYMLDKWTTEHDGVEFADETADVTTFIMPLGAVEIKAEFKLQENPGGEYDITITDDGNGTAVATINGAKVDKAEEGKTVTLTAAPADGYVFLKWTNVSGNVTFADANSSPTTFKMPAGEVEIKAEFKPDIPVVKYPVSVTYGTGGTAKPTLGGQTIAEAEAGATVVLTATLDVNYMLQRWTSDSPGVTIANATALSTTFIMPSNAVTIHAEFVEDTENFDVLTQVSDATVKAYLLGVWDPNSDGKITRAEASRVTRIDVPWTSATAPQVTSLRGIEQFPNLTALDCSYNDLPSINVSGNQALTELLAAGNELTSIDVANNPALTKLFVGGNQLSSINVSQNLALKNLGCANNSLTSLNLSNNTALEKLNADNNAQLSSIILSGLTNLTSLSLVNCGLTSIDLTTNTKLFDVTVSKNRLTSINVGNLTSLVTFSCMQNQLTTLDVTGCTSLWYLDCHGNRMTTLDASSMVARRNGSDYTVFCGLQTSNGTTSQTLTLTLDEDMIEAWNRRWYSNANNANVVLAN